jgi:hypothetical protein
MELELVFENSDVYVMYHDYHTFVVNKNQNIFYCADMDTIGYYTTESGKIYPVLKKSLYGGYILNTVSVLNAR